MESLQQSNKFLADETPAWIQRNAYRSAQLSMSEILLLFSNTLDFSKTQMLNQDPHSCSCWPLSEAAWAQQYYLQVIGFAWELDEKQASYSASDFVLWEIEAARTE